MKGTTGGNIQKLTEMRATLDSTVIIYDENIQPENIGVINGWQGRYGKRGALREYLKLMIEALAVQSAPSGVIRQVARPREPGESRVNAAIVSNIDALGLTEQSNRPPANSLAAPSAVAGARRPWMGNRNVPTTSGGTDGGRKEVRSASTLDGRSRSVTPPSIRGTANAITPYARGTMHTCSLESPETAVTTSLSRSGCCPTFVRHGQALL